MTHRTDVARGRDVVARWCDLAERRLEYLTELFETGRWRRYYSERAFLDNIQEAKTAVEIWRELSTREASSDNFAVDISWLGRTRATRAMLPSGETSREWVHRFQPQPPQIPAEPVPRDVSVAAEPGHGQVDTRHCRDHGTLSAASQCHVGDNNTIPSPVFAGTTEGYRLTALVPITTCANRCAPSAERSGVMARA